MAQKEKNVKKERMQKEENVESGKREFFREGSKRQKENWRKKKLSIKIVNEWKW